MTTDPSDDAAPSPEDPNRSTDDQMAGLDEAPDGHTPLEPTESDAGSLPPGAGQKPE